MSGWIEIAPSGGRDARDLLFEHGVEFPCGGESLCGGCRIRVVAGEIPITDDMRAALSAEELAQGWRLGCRAEIDSTVRIAVEQWSAPVLSDEASVAFEPRGGRGAVIDLGTTTLVVQVVNLATGEVEALRTALNPQARYGADIMTRIQEEGERPGVLGPLIREALGAMLADAAGGGVLREVWIVGNTAMHHLFCGESVEPLASVPFRSPNLGSRLLDAHTLGWNVAVEEGVHFLGCIGGFVGSDILAGLVATGFAEQASEQVLVDLGTNGEIAVGNGGHIRCASTAAGPAFEAGRIGRGMRAGRGAIDRVDARDGGLVCRVIGGGEATGVCGSGLVDAAAAARDLGWIHRSGRVQTADRRIVLDGAVALSQSDIRELQLAKGAVAAGLELLGGGQDRRLHLAGAFGNYVRVESARRIGLIPRWCGEVHPAGNTALRGARMLLLAPSSRERIIARLLEVTDHVELSTLAGFQDTFAECMAFPD